MGWFSDIKDFFGLKHIEHGRYYVYGLLDPRFKKGGESRPFYIGKGIDDRIYQHEKTTRRLLKIGTPWAKTKLQCRHKRIIEIWDEGKQVEYAIYFRSDNENDAYAYEAKVIEHYGVERLTNEVGGHRKR